MKNSSRLDSKDPYTAHPLFVRTMAVAMNYHRYVKLFFSSTALVCVVFLAACNSGSHPPRIGSPAPEFTITDSQRTVALNQFQGKPVLLNFWATWCPPCIQEMPSLVQLQKQLGDKVTIIAVSEDDDDSAYKQFVRDHNVDLLTVRDSGQKANGLYGTFKFPETYVIDRTGKIVRKFIGAQEWTSPEIVDYLKKM
jgi:cytochrome c biogenesis protein CcmG, thiol:disulfide interchange protein DsbE